ncbi:MAG TPA: serine--tRNA ligase [Kiritimatiellia bacterium]|nr:serine--tRNA ligase [Kiritimatiellia bacterium]HMO99381.1 serine--tRNA ligase [Kiritimatiellia bacterium]HMP96503.1 serine--tRNA ligase [Kiritimatiellia bacterium]
MLDIKRIRDATDEVRERLAAKGAESLLDPLLELDRERRRLLTEVEQLKNQRNVVSKEIGARKKAGEDIASVSAEMRQLGDRIAEADQTVRGLEERFNDHLLRMPNLPHASTPIGVDATGNRVVRTHGEPRAFSFTPKPHWEVGQRLGLFDFERGAKIAGAGFPLFTGAGARLERALIQFMLDLHTTRHGYREVSPPVLVNAASMTGTGQLPKMKDDMYYIGADELYLAPTAEVPVTNIYRDEIMPSPLPVYLTAYTPCFRREAGAAGRETRGLIRVHQFDKVELVKFVEPATSYDELESLVQNAEAVLQALDLPYRVLQLCSGDLSFAAAKCYDIELWAPGHDGWLEVSSCSNFEDFQARRANIRYRDAQGKTHFVHTLNGSGVALARLVVAILENFQQEDGSVVMPPALVSYMGGLDRLTSA